VFSDYSFFSCASPFIGVISTAEERRLFAAEVVAYEVAKKAAFTAHSARVLAANAAVAFDVSVDETKEEATQRHTRSVEDAYMAATLAEEDAEEAASLAKARVDEAAARAAAAALVAKARVDEVAARAAEAAAQAKARVDEVAARVAREAAAREAAARKVAAREAAAREAAAREAAEAARELASVRAAEAAAALAASAAEAYARAAAEAAARPAVVAAALHHADPSVFQSIAAALVASSVGLPDGVSAAVRHYAGALESCAAAIAACSAGSAPPQLGMPGVASTATAQATVRGALLLDGVFGAVSALCTGSIQAKAAIAVLSRGAALCAKAEALLVTTTRVVAVSSATGLVATAAVSGAAVSDSAGVASWVDAAAALPGCAAAGSGAASSSAAVAMPQSEVRRVCCVAESPPLRNFRTYSQSFYSPLLPPLPFCSTLASPSSRRRTRRPLSWHHLLRSLTWRRKSSASWPRRTMLSTGWRMLSLC